MPNLAAHMDLAHQAAQLLSHPTLEANTGYFLLGSTSPDIRIITHERREEYHFAPLDFDSIGAGTDGLFDSHPHLRASSDLDGPTRAFIAGYITHLIADETWITGMYRPYFGNREVFQDDALGKVMDRALQLELDRQGWDTVDATLGLVSTATDGINLGFIASDTLAYWREWVVELLSKGFSWNRLNFMARRIAAGDEGHPAGNIATEFVQAMPHSLERLYQLVPRRNLTDFRERTIASLATAVGNYLP